MTQANAGRGQALLALALLCLINTFSNVDRSMLALVMPTMSKELALSDTITGLVAGLPFALCYAACAVPVAWIADNYSRRNLLAAALTFWSVITMLTGAVQNGWQLAVARFGLGAGESAGNPTTTSLIAGSFALENRTPAFSALAASAYVGPLIGFPAIGWIIAHHGWRAAYFAAGASGIVVALIFLMLVREPPRPPLAQNGGATGFFPRVRQLFRTPSYLLVVLAGGFSATSQGAHLTWGPTFLDRVHGLGPEEIGFYFGTLRGAAGLAGAATAALAIGALVRRDMAWQLRAAIVISALPFVADCLFLFAGNAALWRIGLGLNAFFTAIIVAMSYPLHVNVAAPNLRATASAFYFLVLSLMGFMLGPFIVGALSDALRERLGGQSLATAMLVASAVALLSSLMLIRARRTWLDDVRKAEIG